ncbi:response regulator [Cohnella fermenti]|uniref:Response regulator n=1 Tax=Cohnella fermenti TaxID=2565925 RepID=A0A4S4BHR6_9BACL|nr:helix-turn-helix domain-containing protein [Cohnella fermenti]THF74071.1 response regulator [Cohnella fermenti]
MHRLLIVDDEEIITDSLYEVFSRLMPERLDVCRAYSADEALAWMERTRIDIVLTDIRMPGKSGLELSEQIRSYWPRCKVIFLTGYSEFDYVYQAIQAPAARYLLKTEGYDKVTETVKEVLQEIDESIRLGELAQLTLDQQSEIEALARAEYFRQWLQDGSEGERGGDALAREFDTWSIPLSADESVVLVLARLGYPEGATYVRRNELRGACRRIWLSYLSERTRSLDFVDKRGELLWLLQPAKQADESFSGRMLRYLEGTLELIQETCRQELGLTLSISIAGAACEWSAVPGQYERLRRLQQTRIGDELSVILAESGEARGGLEQTDDARISHMAEIMAAHLEADRKEKFFAVLDELSGRMLHPEMNVQTAVEAYYSVALMLFAYMNRWGLHAQIGDSDKLLHLDGHTTLTEGFHYLSRVADGIFSLKRLDEQERADRAIDRICRYIQENLGRDLSLVRLAELNHFNPTYLSRFFKQEKGLNLSEYIDQCRIRKAMELLKDGETKVREVSVAVGYESAHSFTRFFKKTTGMTPQEYRDSIPIG